MRRVSALAAAFTIALAPTRAKADETPPSSLVEQGLALRRQGRDAEALALFRRAYATAPAPRTLAQVALAEQALGRWRVAEEDLTAALAVTGDPWVAHERTVLAQALATVRSHLGLLEVTADAPGVLWLNGERVGELPRPPVHVEAGSVIVEVRAEGYEAARRIASVEPGGQARETVHMVPLPPAPEPPSTSAPSLHSSPHAPASAPALDVGPSPTLQPVDAPRADLAMRRVSFVVFGAGAAGLAAGIAYGARTLAEKNARNQQCTGGCDAQGVADDREARILSVQSTAWFIGGLGAAAAGAILFVLSRPAAAHHTSTAWSVTPEIGAERALLRVSVPW